MGAESSGFPVGSEWSGLWFFWRMGVVETLSGVFWALIPFSVPQFTHLPSSEGSSGNWEALHCFTKLES